MLSEALATAVRSYLRHALEDDALSDLVHESLADALLADAGSADASLLEVVHLLAARDAELLSDGEFRVRLAELASTTPTRRMPFGSANGGVRLIANVTNSASGLFATA